jgi:small ligand-binding sensory domain FIST
VADPFSFPADALLRHLNDVPSRPIIVGGMASGGAGPGETALFLDDGVLHEGAVGVRLPASAELTTLVSQGCRPFGASFVVTRARDNFLLELGGRPPLERLEEALASLSKPDRELAANGLHVGRVIDEYKTEHGQGDFLIRGVLGVDPDSGALAVGDRVEVGESVRFHVRDAATADDELRSLLQQQLPHLSGRPAGALLFTCNGRGTRLFPEPDHDARIVSDALDDAAVAGFFCAGEFGPVGGRNFLHGFTASLAIFVDGPRA